MEITTLFLGGLPQTIEESQALEILSKVGQVEVIRIVLDSKTKKGRGYAFFDIDDTLKKKFLQSQLVCEGRILQIRDANIRLQPESNIQKHRVFFQFSEFEKKEILKESLSRYGQLVDFYLYTDFLGKLKGYGFCDFETKDSKIKLLEKESILLENDQSIRIYSDKAKLSKAAKLLKRKLNKKRRLVKNQETSHLRDSQSDKAYESVNESVSKPQTVRMDINDVQDPQDLVNLLLGDVHDSSATTVKNIVACSSRFTNRDNELRMNRVIHHFALFCYYIY